MGLYYVVYLGFFVIGLYGAILTPMITFIGAMVYCIIAVAAWVGLTTWVENGTE